MTIRVSDGYVLIDVYVQPGAKVTQVCGLHAERLKIKISAPPVDGKANLEVIDFFAQLIKLPKRDVILDSGEKSRNKRVRINTNDLKQIDILRKLYE